MATNQTVKNKFGTLAGWNRITTNIMGRDIEAYKRIYYSDTVAKTNAYGGSNFPIGREEGNYECEAGFELYQEEVRGLMASLVPGSRLQDIKPFDITVEYQMGSGVILRDRIMNCEFTNNGVDVKQGDGSIVTEYKLICSHIEWNTI
jgi:hypothetical protein